MVVCYIMYLLITKLQKNVSHLIISCTSSKLIPTFWAFLFLVSLPTHISFWPLSSNPLAIHSAGQLWVVCPYSMVVAIGLISEPEIELVKKVQTVYCFCDNVPLRFARS